MQLSPDQVQAVNILLNATQVAQRRGAFSLADAHTIQEAIDKLVPREEQEAAQESGQEGPEDVLTQQPQADDTAAD